jgi:hypothetical protein
MNVMHVVHNINTCTQCLKYAWSISEIDRSYEYTDSNSCLRFLLYPLQEPKLLSLIVSSIPTCNHEAQKDVRVNYRFVHQIKFCQTNSLCRYKRCILFVKIQIPT